MQKYAGDSKDSSTEHRRKLSQGTQKWQMALIVYEISFLALIQISKK